MGREAPGEASAAGVGGPGQRGQVRPVRAPRTLPAPVCPVSLRLLPLEVSVFLGSQLMALGGSGPSLLEVPAGVEAGAVCSSPLCQAASRKSSGQAGGEQDYLEGHQGFRTKALAAERACASACKGGCAQAWCSEKRLSRGGGGRGRLLRKPRPSGRCWRCPPTQRGRAGACFVERRG